MKEHPEKYRLVKITPGNIRQSHIYINGHYDFFPEECVGQSQEFDNQYGKYFELILDGLNETIHADIGRDAKTKKPRRFFRQRSWVSRFFTHHKIKAGDYVVIERINKYKYSIYPCTNGDKNIIKPCASTSEITPKKANRKKLDINYQRICKCKPTHINCLEAKEWLKCQIGVWQFSYEGRDIRDKKMHPATFPISLSKKVIELFTHEGELALDPFVGSGTTLVAANDTNRNAVGFDLQEKYILLCKKRLSQGNMFNKAKQIAIVDDARHIDRYFEKETVSLIWTSPPYANLLNRTRKNKSRRDRKNEQLGKVEQYSQDKRDLGTMALEKYTKSMGEIFGALLPLLRPKAHCVINVPDMWWENKRITIHVSLIEEFRRRGYELRNIIIWDRTNIVNRIGIFGWPSNYITMGVTFEYLLDFWRPPIK